MTLSALVLTTYLIGVGTFFEKTFGPKEKFSSYRDEIAIVRISIQPTNFWKQLAHQCCWDAHKSQ